MPQMSPINWVSLFIYFLIIFMIFNILNYYSTLAFKPQNKHMSYLMKFNWKW